jgi:hypothetical protein
MEKSKIKDINKLVYAMVSDGESPSGIGREVLVRWNQDCSRKTPDAPHFLVVGAGNSRDPGPVRLR